MSFLSKLFSLLSSSESEAKQVEPSKPKYQSDSSILDYSNFEKDAEIEDLCDEIEDDEYIINMHIGRSWILPQMLEMGMDSSGRFDKKRYLKSLSEMKLVKKYNIVTRNANALLKIIDKDPEGYKVRARWWTKDVIMSMLRCIAGSHMQKDVAQRLNDRINSLSRITDDKKFYKAVLKFNDTDYLYLAQSKCEAFDNAYIGDGAYSAMITLTKYYGICCEDQSGRMMSRDECLDYIETKAEEYKNDGMKLLDICIEKYFAKDGFQNLLKSAKKAKNA